MLSGARSRYGKRASIPLILSYVLDWVVIILAFAVAAAWASITPNKRPFSLVDPNISFPFVTKEKISTAVLVVAAGVAPVAVIFLVALLLVPGPTVPKSTPKSLILKRKLWELHTGWLGLALSIASSFLITQGMKNLFGKPRPDLLSRCQPDLENVSKYIVGGFSNFSDIPGRYNLVSAAICQNTDMHILNDGFRSYPSGHASFAASGLIYLSLFIASKFAITIPFLAPRSYSRNTSFHSAFPSRSESSQKRSQTPSEENPDKGASTFDGQIQPSGHDDAVIAARHQAAAPPVYLLVFAIIPFFGSIYIASTRWSDFRHHGFDILFGYLIGTATAIFAFRWYHLPISQGAGWSWGPRSSQRSFWAGVGVGSYAGGADAAGAVGGAAASGNDLELGGTGPSQRHDVGADSGRAP